jgi:hypothetical protein
MIKMTNLKIITSKLVLLFLILSIIIVNISCTQLFDLVGLFIKNEIVMCKGMSIEVNNKSEKLKIEALNKFKREYSWDSKSVTLTLMPRQQRLNGSLGIYSPTGAEGIHCVVQEGQQHFCSKQDIMDWIHNCHFYTDTGLNFIYTNNGLGIGWGIRIKPDDPNMIALLVDVWQFYINGKKPDSLPGATDSLVNISFDKNIIPCMPTVGKFIPSQPTIINERHYSGKAIDLMKEHNISSKDVERIIQQPGWEYKHGVYCTYGLKFQIKWITMDKNGRIVLAGK